MRRNEMNAPQMLILQHIACEPAAAYEDELRDRGIGCIKVEIDEGESIPDWREFAGIIAMGGPIGAYEESAYPWLTVEKRVIADAVRAGLPFWGVCLGAQLLAASLGAAVYPGRQPEVGMEPVTLTRAAQRDLVFAGAPPTFTVLQWHSDTFDLPVGATLLASSEAYRHQAFAWGKAYGLQFHLEVYPELAAQWADVPAYAATLESLHGPGAVDRLVADLQGEVTETLPLARRLFGRWLEEVADIGSPSGGGSAAQGKAMSLSHNDERGVSETP